MPETPWVRSCFIPTDGSVKRLNSCSRGTDGSQTHRWREMDSNFQYAGTVNLVVASLCRSIAWDGSAHRSGVTAIAGSGREFWHDGNLRVQQDARIAPGCCRADQ